MKLNVDGKKKIKTLPGGITSVFLTFVILGFLIQKSLIVFNRSNPIISLTEEEGAFDASNEVNLDEIGFKIAFGVEDFYT